MPAALRLCHHPLGRGMRGMGRCHTPALQVWDGNQQVLGQFDSLAACMDAARERQLPLAYERDLVMLHTITPHYDAVKQGEAVGRRGGGVCSAWMCGAPWHALAAVTAVVERCCCRCCHRGCCWMQFTTWTSRGA